MTTAPSLQAPQQQAGQLGSRAEAAVRLPRAAHVARADPEVRTRPARCMLQPAHLFACAPPTRRWWMRPAACSTRTCRRQVGRHDPLRYTATTDSYRRARLTLRYTIDYTERNGTHQGDDVMGAKAPMFTDSDAAGAGAAAKDTGKRTALHTGQSPSIHCHLPCGKPFLSVLGGMTATRGPV